MKQIVPVIKGRPGIIFSSVLALFIMMLFTQSCYNRKADIVYPAPVTCDTSNVRYSVEVVNILKANCYVCHSPGFAPSRIFLNNYTTVKGLTAGNYLLDVIMHTPGFDPMPKNQPKLKECDIATIRTWMRNGAPNN